jgi:hypothetical protein
VIDNTKTSATKGEKMTKKKKKKKKTQPWLLTLTASPNPDATRAGHHVCPVDTRHTTAIAIKGCVERDLNHIHTLKIHRDNARCIHRRRKKKKKNQQKINKKHQTLATSPNPNATPEGLHLTHP